MTASTVQHSALGEFELEDEYEGEEFDLGGVISGLLGEGEFEDEFEGEEEYEDEFEFEDEWEGEFRGRGDGQPAAPGVPGRDDGTPRPRRRGGGDRSRG